MMVNITKKMIVQGWDLLQWVKHSEFQGSVWIYINNSVAILYITIIMIMVCLVLWSDKNDA